MWGRDVGALVVVDMVGEDSVVEEEDVEDMVFDEICVREKRDEGQFVGSDTM
jgi:hypothetical protein